MWWIPVTIGVAWLASEIFSDDSSGSDNNSSHYDQEAERRRQERKAAELREQAETKQREVHRRVTMKSLQGELSNLCQQHEVASVDLSELLKDPESIIFQQQKNSRKKNQSELDNAAARISLLKLLQNSLN